MPIAREDEAQLKFTCDRAFQVTLKQPKGAMLQTHILLKLLAESIHLLHMCVHIVMALHRLARWFALRVCAHVNVHTSLHNELTVVLALHRSWASCRRMQCHAICA